MHKKKAIISDLFHCCREHSDMKFNNDLVNKFSVQYQYKKPFNVTKIDRSCSLPDELLKEGYCIVNLGKGNHQFIKEIGRWYHKFEEIDNSEKIAWNYKPNLLNHTDISKSNIISTVYNQRMIHKFIYQDIAVKPKIHLSRRTKISTEYIVGDHIVETDDLKIKIDTTFEHNGIITVVEGENTKNFSGDFSVNQLFHPFLYYHNHIREFKRLECCYLLQKRVTHPKTKEQSIFIRLYLYRFSNSNDISSIELIRKAEYSFNPITPQHS